jgi:predicted HAD superfamily hydrolase
VILFPKGQTIIDGNYNYNKYVPANIMSDSFYIPLGHVNLIHCNNQMVEIENVDDVDDLITVCLVAIKIVIGLINAAISNIKDNSKCKIDQTKLIT